MRVVVEETNSATENKRKTTVECEKDDATLDVTLDMIFRGLIAYGYTPEDIRETITQMFTRPPANESTENEEVPSIE